MDLYERELAQLLLRWLPFGGPPNEDLAKLGVDLPRAVSIALKHVDSDAPSGVSDHQLITQLSDHQAALRALVAAQKGPPQTIRKHTAKKSDRYR